MEDPKPSSPTTTAKAGSSSSKWSVVTSSHHFGAVHDSSRFYDRASCVKIRKTVEEKVISILSDAKPLLRKALLSLTESMRKDPDKYSSFIYHNRTYIPGIL